MESAENNLRNIPDVNGFVLGDTYIPEETLATILSFVDKITLNYNCTLVCKNWKYIIENVWKLKARRDFSKYFSNSKISKTLHWSVYRSVVFYNCFGKNLLKNNSGQKGLKNWKIIRNGGDRWLVEKPPIGVIGDETNSHLYKSAFVSSYGWCEKYQIINLIKEGVGEFVMDHYKPDIVVSERYAPRWDCGSVYKLKVQLLNKEKVPIKEFAYNDELTSWTNGWKEVNHTFSSYNSGVRYIHFEHGGKDLQFWAGHYGSKMTNASIIIPLIGIDKTSE